MPDTPPLKVGFGTPFQAQVDYLRNKIPLPSERGDDITRAAHDRAFIVAGAAKADLIADLQAAVVKAAESGGGLNAFRKDFKAIVAKHGWTGWTGEGTKEGEAWRTRIIYQTNMATSYAAGQRAQMTDPGYIRFHPYWRYLHSDGVLHPRPLHLAWHGLTLRHDHPFWDTHFPPNGWGCQCRITTVTKREGEASAAAGLGEPPRGWQDINPKTGEEIGIDKGFGYAPGANLATPLQDLVDQKLIKMDAPLGAAVAEALRPVMQAERAVAFAEWANAIVNSGKTTGEYRVLDALDTKLIVRLQQEGVVPASAEIVARDKDVAHAFRDSKSSGVPWEWYLELPLRLNSPRAVILDRSTPDRPTLLYVFDLPGDTSNLARIVLKLDYVVTEKVIVDAKEVKRKKLLNVLRTGSIVKPDDLKNPAKFTTLQGEV